MSGEAHTADELRELPVELIVPNPNQPRRRFDEEALNALAGSLGERGVLQPVLVRPKPGGTYELVAGERRWRAAQIAGLKEMPALVRARDDAASLELALIENMAREDLNPIEEARACAALVEELGLTREEVGRRVGRSRVAVSNLLRLLDLPDEAIELLEQGGSARDTVGRCCWRRITPRGAASRGTRRRRAGLCGSSKRARGRRTRPAGLRARRSGARARDRKCTPTRKRRPRRSRRRSERRWGRGAGAGGEGRIPRGAVVRRPRGSARAGAEAAGRSKAPGVVY